MIDIHLLLELHGTEADRNRIEYDGVGEISEDLSVFEDCADFA